MIRSKELFVLLSVGGVCLLVVEGTAASAGGDYPFRPVAFTDVKISDKFWEPRLVTNRDVTIPYDFAKCEETGRIANFDVAAGRIEGKFRGHFGFNDSDFFKVIEGAAYSLALYPDAELEKYVDELVGKIAAAQTDDGYIYTANTIGEYADKIYCCVSEERWSDLKSGHELYNVGHMYEAAVAHYQATGKRDFLDVAVKNADLLCRVFGPGKNRGVPGHQEIEIGLVKLYRVTGDDKYLKLAKFFLDERGNAKGHELFGSYNQDHKPVVEQSEAVGHAVRAGYMYSAMADVAALTGDNDYIEAMKRIWENVVSKKQHVTGGVGARHAGESFGDDYELPNKTAYNETCAAIANAMWNHRMFLLCGDGKYIDVLERVLYNGFLSGVSLGGDKFFYPNPLASESINESATRRPWFDCSCCPTNVVRFMPSLGGYIYA
ncbi:MAG: glycoside hydrolase family 127 protein, partial [Planctomycetota bacterium]